MHPLLALAFIVVTADGAPAAGDPKSSPWNLNAQAIPAAALVEDADPGDVIHVVIVPPAEPELAALGPRLARATKQAILKLNKVKHVYAVKMDAVKTDDADADVVTARLAKGATRVVIIHLYPPDAQTSVPRVLYSVYSDAAGAPDVTQVSVGVVVPGQRAVEKGMARIFADDDEDGSEAEASADDDEEEKKPAPPPEKKKRKKRQSSEEEAAAEKEQEEKLAEFKQRALTVRTISARKSDSGHAEYRIERNGTELDEEELEKLHLEDVDAAVGAVEGPSVSSRLLRAWPAAGIVCFPLGCGGVTAVCCGGACAAYVAYSGLVNGWSAVNIVFNAAIYAFFAGLAGIPATVVGLLPGGASLAVGIASAYLAGSAGPHPYLAAVTRENLRLARELGLEASRVPRTYLPARDGGD